MNSDISRAAWNRLLRSVNSPGRLADLYCLVGVGVVLKAVVKCLWIMRSKITTNDDIFKKAGSWALVTGCTNGLGKEYALQLAAKGMNIILVSRNAQLLDEVAREIGNEHGVRTMVIVMDFTTDDMTAYQKLARQIQGFDIGVLVNNVGIADDPRLFHEVPAKKVTDLINVNMMSLAMMCQVVMPAMATKRRGIVINLSSGLGTHPVSFVSLYGASKGFVDFFSRSIQEEYKYWGITVQSVIPYFISTNMTKRVDTAFFIPDARTFVQNELSTVGRESRTYGYWRHSLQGAVMTSLPHSVLYQIMKFIKYNSDKMDQK